MVQFLYQGGKGSHGPRTQALANVTPGSQYGDIATTVPAMVRGLDTLAFWGHGDRFQLCGKTADEIFAIIKAWKRLNPGLQTIEMITCNARHATHGDPFATQVKGKFGIMSGTRGMVVKGLPVNVGGTSNAWSILLAETNFNSWVYITAPGETDKLLMVANSLIQFEATESGGLKSFRGDIAQRADEAVRANPTREWTMNYGYMNTLRAHLVVVR